MSKLLIDRAEVVKILKHSPTLKTFLEPFEIEDVIKKVYEIPTVEFSTISETFRAGYEYARSIKNLW